VDVEGDPLGIEAAGLLFPPPGPFGPRFPLAESGGQALDFLGRQRPALRFLQKTNKAISLAR